MRTYAKCTIASMVVASIAGLAVAEQRPIHYVDLESNEVVEDQG